MPQTDGTRPRRAPRDLLAGAAPGLVLYRVGAGLRLAPVSTWLTIDAPLDEKGQGGLLEWRLDGQTWTPRSLGQACPLGVLSVLPGWARAESSEGWIVMLGSALAGACEPRLRGLPHSREGPVLWAAELKASRELEPCAGGDRPPYSVGRFATTTGRCGFVDGVRRALEYIQSGDVYQVNLTHRVAGSFAGSARSLFMDTVAGVDPRYALYAECPRPGGFHTAISASPELFLRFDPVSRRVETHPMKGTAALEQAGLLQASPKERAELGMIVDLMRNDLGRVCEAGSVRVEDPRRIERLGSGMLQASACVAGTLSPGRDLADLLRATFPPGSVTGCPKIRALEVISELEGTPRGLYCGAMGRLGSDGSLELAVSIRTAEITGAFDQPGSYARATLSMGVGAGIVFGSEPESEWRETLLKAQTFTSLSGIARAGGTDSRA